MTGKFDVLVIDTNIIASALIFRSSIPRQALEYAFENATVLCSSATRNELREVVSRPKFDRYVAVELRMRELEILIEEMTPIKAISRFQACRDPKDDKFLELAVAGNATCLLSGDRHLLEMHPFRGIPILTPGDYLNPTSDLSK